MGQDLFPKCGCRISQMICQSISQSLHYSPEEFHSSQSDISLEAMDLLGMNNFISFAIFSRPRMPS